MRQSVLAGITVITLMVMSMVLLISALSSAEAGNPDLKYRIKELDNGRRIECIMRRPVGGISCNWNEDL